MRTQPLAGFLLVCLACLTGAGLAAERQGMPGLKVPVQASPTLHGLDQAYTRADGALVITGRLSGTGTLQIPRVVIEGTVAPGNSPAVSTSPGMSPSAPLPRCRWKLAVRCPVRDMTVSRSPACSR